VSVCKRLQYLIDFEHFLDLLKYDHYNFQNNIIY